MKTMLVILVWAATSIAQGGQWTALVATEGAMVTLEKSIVPAPVPDNSGSTLSVDVRVPGAAAASCLVEGACRNGVCASRIREGTPPVGNAHTQAQPSAACAGGVCLQAADARQAAALQSVAAAICGARGCDRPNTARIRWRLFRR